MLNSNRSRKRLTHHLLIPFISLITAGVIYGILLYFYPEDQRRIFRFSLSSAYIAILLLTATLSLGAWNLIRQQVNPVSSDLRRDIGIWCGVFTIIHVLFGLNVHLQSWTQYFFDNSGHLLRDAFGIANYSGVLATLILLLLLLTSNDFSLRSLGRNRWKFLQRWNYLFIFITAFHGFVYQFVEKRLLLFGLILGFICFSIIGIQIVGFYKKTRDNIKKK